MSGTTVDAAVRGLARLRASVDAMGPSWVAGAIAAGPATMASLLTAGASFGYELLWVVVLSAGAGALAQYLAMRLGLATERGIVGAVERHLGGGWAWLLVADVVLAAGVAQLVIMKTVATVTATITGVDARVWGVVWALVLAAGLAGRGYRFVEFVAKGLVALVVAAFVLSLTVVPVAPGRAVAGLVPTLPAGSGVVAAGILGGAVHVTLLTVHTYTVRARGWTEGDRGVATADVAASMVGAFGLYSVAVFLVAASVLTDPDLTTVGAAAALGPLVGPAATWLFLVGLGGAALSTLGGNTIVPPLLVADRLGWDLTVEDPRYRGLLAAAALLSAPGAFVGGEVLGLLVLVLAVGTVGTPFAIAVVLSLLYADGTPVAPGRAAGLGGLALLGVSGALAANFVRERLAGVGAGGLDPLTAAVLAFALVLAAATLALGGRFARDRLA
jgi:manganese transport protein